MIRVLLGVLTAACLLVAQDARAAGPFDGNWTVVITCPEAKGALGYVYRFQASVIDSQLHGERGTRQSGGWLSLEGPIRPDGTAMLEAQGLTNQRVYAVGAVAPQSPYRFRLSAQFSPTQGTGTRLDIRPCTATFQKS